jgi:uncharacterized alkaline shock family protein YloU
LSKEIVNASGRIIISKDVIANLAGIAATECFGVVGMVSSRFSDGIMELLGKESLSKGVDIIPDADAFNISLNIVVSYGMNVSVVAENVMGNVRYTVEKHTGLKLKNVGVNVQGIKIVD